MTRRSSSLLVLVLLFVGLSAPRTAAQGFTQYGFTTFTTNVAVTTTTEISVVASPPVTAPRDNDDVCIIAWAQLTTGTMTTTVTPRIRQGTAATGTLVGEANAETIKVAAAGTEPFYTMVCETRSNVGSVQYNFTLQQAGANADGTALQGGILVLVR
jgi:hypothetical protein